MVATTFPRLKNVVSETSLQKVHRCFMNVMSDPVPGSSVALYLLMYSLRNSNCLYDPTLNTFCMPCTLIKLNEVLISGLRSTDLHDHRSGTSQMPVQLDVY